MLHLQQPPSFTECGTPGEPNSNSGFVCGLMYLAELRGRTEPIRVGVVGIGRMGRGVVDQVSSMPGMRVKATGRPEVGARVAADAIENRRHVVMLNVEADVVVGPILAERARRAGVVYTLAAGDQPGAIFELAERAQTLGFKVV